MAEEDRYKFLERVNMKPGSSRVVVELTVAIEEGTWGADCTIAQAVAQAVEGARTTLENVLRDSPVRVLGVRTARVVCDAEAKR